MHAMTRTALIMYLGLAFFASTSFSTVRADDTDIYLRNAPAPEAVPLVMFSIDYRPDLGSTVCANVDVDCAAADYFRGFPKTKVWLDSTVPAGGKFEYFDMLRLALHVTLTQITGVKVGLMLNHDNRNNCAGPGQTGCSNGGYIIRGLQELQANDANGALAAFEKALFAIPAPQGNVSHAFQGKELYFEFFRYLTGHKIYNVFNGYTDFGTSSTENLNVDFPAASWDTSIIVEEISNGVKKYDRYVSPFTQSNSCVQAFAVNFYGGKVNQQDDSDAAILASKLDGGMAGINLAGTNNSFNTVVAYMRDADLADGTFGVDAGAAPALSGKQGVTSYFLTGQPVKADHDLAKAGGTQKALELTSNPEELVKTLLDIFQEILSVSTTFVAASVPVNVFNRAESLDNVFIALFQAEERRLWPGNLKKLKLKVVESEVDQSKRVELQDVNGNSAIALDGRIKHDALTYWTDPNALPPPTDGTQEVAGRDGRAIKRGAAGQKIPGFIADNIGQLNGGSGEPLAGGPRKVLRDNGTNALLADLNVDATTIAALKGHLNAVDDAEATTLIKWIRGLDPATGTKRPWILGDPLHSRPLPINYGLHSGHKETENALIYVAMASNDGFMHFFRNTDASKNELGKEVWAFMPNEVMGEVKKLYENTADKTHPYTVDGAPSSFVFDDGDGTINGTDKVYLYFGLRRGGKAYYALDVTNPDSPKLQWKKTKTELPKLGQTWSRPATGYVDHNGDGTRDPVIVVAGGYDTNKDVRGGAVGSSDTEGNVVYVLDAINGDLIWAASHTSMVDSIPSDPTVVDTDGDNLIDRILVGDTGGRVWRIDTFGPKANWQTTILASVGRHADTGSVNDRRFFHRPDFVQTQVEVTDSQTGEVSIERFDAVILGSGNRPNPLDYEYTDATVKPKNFMYMIRDNRIHPANASSNPVYAVNDLVTGATNDYVHANFGDITDTTSQPTAQGWKLELNVGEGEKSLSSPLTLSNTVYFTTYLPKGTYEDQVESTTDPATCGPSEGSGLLYAVNLQTGRAALNYNTSDDSTAGDGSASDRYKELSSAGIPADVVGVSLDGQAYVLPPDLGPEKANASSRWRTFWYEVENSDL